MSAGEEGWRGLTLAVSPRTSRRPVLTPPPRSPFSSPRLLRSRRFVATAVSLSPPTSPPCSPLASPTVGRPHLRLSVRSLVSLGVGSTDGKTLTVTRVPTNPTDLLNLNTPTVGEDCSVGSSYWEDWEDSCSESCLGGEECPAARQGGGRRHRGPRTRGHWSNKVQFILACVGYSVGLCTLWRFPYLCYSSGGGVFLIPYYLILVTCGVPLLYMELAVGQFTKRGPIGAFSKLCPLFKGAGLSNVVVSLFVSTYYNVIIAYALFYLFTSFKSRSPWSECTNRWNTVHCWSGHGPANATPPINSTSPAEEFYEHKVLQVSSGIDMPGEVRWELAACLLFCWILVYFALWKSVKSSGRVLYFTATLPFILVLAFLGRTLTLDGASIGLDYFFKPRWHLLADSKVWVNAAAQNFQSIGIAFGTVVSFASYNRHSNQILVDTLTVSVISGLASFVVGVFAFATLGTIAKQHNTSIEDVITDGPGMVFIIYPEVMSKMPFPGLWAVLFFFMLLCLGLNSQFALVEVVVTSVQDGFPNWIKKKLVCHEILVLFVCTVSFALGIPYITQGGIYVFQLVDYYVVTNSVMYIAFFEVVAIAWFYGSERLSQNIARMTSKQTNIYFKICWKVIAPVFIMCVWIFSLIDYEAPTYDNGRYQYPRWAEMVGWVITVACLICIPVIAVYVVLRAEGKTLTQKFLNSIKPQIEDFGNGMLLDTPIKEMKSLIGDGAEKQTNHIQIKTP